MQQSLPACFLACPQAGSLPIQAIRPAALGALLKRLPPYQAAYLEAFGFAARAGQIVVLPGEAGLGGAVLGLGEAVGPHVWGALPGALPAGTVWHLDAGLGDLEDACLGFALGAYRFDRMSGAARPVLPRLVLPAMRDIAGTLSAVRACWLARDLINLPANRLGPADLAEAVRTALSSAGAHVDVIVGNVLHSRFPVIDAVGAGSARPPAVVVARWACPGVAADAPLLSICGKGVCFDSGGHDLKPPGAMLRMKKDMAGAAIALGLACMIIDAQLPARLELRLGCVENMVSGSAMRPLDVVTARGGMTIEIGNTDAEGRLVLCDLLAEACESQPAALLDFATLTGAARAALGPDLPALFSNDDVLANRLLASGRLEGDPVWRLPLWEDYQNWLESSIADLGNVSDRPHAGAIVAALFLQRFVSDGTKWAHFDVYGWNDASRPGRPLGGECQGMRAAFAALKQLVTTAEC